jgi:hypothetical protein
MVSLSILQKKKSNFLNNWEASSFPESVLLLRIFPLLCLWPCQLYRIKILHPPQYSTRGMLRNTRRRTWYCTCIICRKIMSMRNLFGVGRVNFQSFIEAPERRKPKFAVQLAPMIIFIWAIPSSNLDLDAGYLESDWAKPLLAYPFQSNIQ